MRIQPANRHPVGSIGIVLSLLLLAMLLCTSGCTSVRLVSSPAPEQRIVWPPPPLEPRIEWVREIKSHRDLGVQPGFWQRLVGFIAGEQEERFLRPYGIWASSGKRFVLVDSGAAKVHLVDLEKGRYLPLPEAGTVKLLSPIGVTEDDRENLYVTDSGTGQLFRYSLADGTLAPFVTYRFKRPSGVAFNPVNRLLYVVETAAHQVVAIDSRGMERFRFGSRGSGAGQFNFPTDLAIDRSGRVIVTDSLNGRIQIFAADGTAAGGFGEPGDTAGRFARPKGVALDSEGHIYVCDSQQDLVQIFDDNGRLLLAFGENGSEPGQFWMPSGIFIDNDTIYVADTYNQRVQVFRYLKGEPGSRDPHAQD